MKITLLLNQIKVPLQDDIQKAVKYFADNEMDIEFITRDIDIPLPPLVPNGTDNGQIQYVFKAKSISKPFIANDVTIFAFNAQELIKPSDGYITSSAGEGDNFITLKTDEFDDRTDWLWKAIVHELMHSLVKILRAKGIFIGDVMDSTWNPKENKYVSYWNNHDPYAKEGNFASQWREIKRILTISQGARGTLVKELQQLLRDKGYFKYPLNTGTFGSVTRTALIHFQKDNGLQPDGICGMKSWRLLKQLKKNFSIDLSKWGLTPECEHKAFQFLTINKAEGRNLKIYNGRRTQKEQDEKWAQGRTKPGPKITWTRNSKHVQGLAFDVCFDDNDPFREKVKNFDWSPIGKVGESIGLKWGVVKNGKQIDPGHFEL